MFPRLGKTPEKPQRGYSPPPPPLHFCVRGLNALGLNVDVKALVQIWEALVLNVSLEETTTSTVVSKFRQLS